MLEKLSAYILSCLLIFCAKAQIQPIGYWRQHFPWGKVIQVTAGNGVVWGATTSGVFSISTKDSEIKTYTKIEGLQSTDLTAIAWDSTSATLVIAYQNGQIDLLQHQNIKGIATLKESTKAWTKTIRHIYTRNGIAYLSTDFGILVLDLNIGEVKDTYIIGSTGLPLPVYTLDFDGTSFFAATAEGVKNIALSRGNLADFNNWNHTSTQASQCKNFRGKMILENNDSLWIPHAGQWRFFYADSHEIISLQTSENYLIVGEKDRLVILNENGTVYKIISDPQKIPNPLQAISQLGSFWIADGSAGLLKFEGNSISTYTPMGPQSLNFTKLATTSGRLYATSGDASIQLFENQQWGQIDSTDFSVLKGLQQFDCFALHPLNGNLWASARGQALVSIESDKITRWEQPGNKQIGAMHVDAKGQLWLTYDTAAHQLWVRKKEGGWMSFAIPFAYNGIHISKIISDALGQIWLILPAGEGVVCFSYGPSIDNRGDDQWKRYLAGQGNGNLPSNQVYDMMADRDGFIWFGTEKGIGILQCIQEVFTGNGCEVYLPIVQQGNFASYLFRDKFVTSMVTDGANRKWIGTAQDGVWLISDAGDQTLQQFNIDNSPLPHNQIQQMVIAPSSGEVFFSTAGGMVSYRSDATEDNISNTDPVLVFPNPVSPNYTGTIAIRGLRHNSIVKITGLDGRLIFETRSLGGQAIWNGKNYRGQTVMPGVYLVLIQDEMKTYKTATKLVFAGKL